jgi:hypothetical protein
MGCAVETPLGTVDDRSKREVGDCTAGGHQMTTVVGVGVAALRMEQYESTVGSDVGILDSKRREHPPPVWACKRPHTSMWITGDKYLTPDSVPRQCRRMRGRETYRGVYWRRVVRRGSHEHERFA